MYRGILEEINNLFFIRNARGQKAVGWHIQNARRKRLSMKNSISNIIIQKRRRNLRHSQINREREKERGRGRENEFITGNE